MIMLELAVIIGILAWYFTGYWWLMPLCIIGSFVWPLGDNIYRRKRETK